MYRTSKALNKFWNNNQKSESISFAVSKPDTLTDYTRLQLTDYTRPSGSIGSLNVTKELGLSISLLICINMKLLHNIQLIANMFNFYDKLTNTFSLAFLWKDNSSSEVALNSCLAFASMIRRNAGSLYLKHTCKTR